ncbi:MAG: ABC transporter substrate-binding protein [Oscillospiraceae bacterium]|jgi:NitT/TauT family transport system substrate-binding protein|nr:ABC transporter substrate-binding protein [Oscillospiraceae bacterium]
MKTKFTNIIAAVLSLCLLLAVAGCDNKSESGSTGGTSGAGGTSDTSGASQTTGSEDNSGETPTTSAPVLEQTSFKLGHLNSTAHLLGFVAKEEGFFKEEGLDAELLLFSNGTELVNALEAKQIDAAFLGAVPTITFQSNGRQISVFGGAMTNGHGYVCKPELLDGLDNWDITVLKGKNVATVKNSVQDLELLMLLTDAGLSYGAPEENKDVNVIYFDSQKDAFNALANAEIDAASAYSPYTSIAKNLGYEVIYYCNDVHMFENQPCCRQVALTEALEAKPNTYEAFERALIKAYKFSQEEEDKTIAAVKTYIDIDVEDIRFEVYGGYAFSHPDPDKKSTTEFKASVVDFGYTEDYDIEQHYNTAIYEAALSKILEENPDDSIYLGLLERFNSER